MAKAYIGVGSNLGDRQALIQEAADRLARVPGVTFRAKSSIHETDPVDAEGGKYLNAVWEIDTELNARELMAALLTIESAMGRVRTRKNAARPIDLDILFFGGQKIEEPGLSIPHPRLHERAFVLKPLAELDSELRHPGKKKTVADMLRDLES